jgi:hypothetical protein
MKSISAIVTRGPKKGTVMTPHRYQEGYFLVGKDSNRRSDATEVTDESALESWVKLGYGIRMSAPGVAPSLFMPKGIFISNT